MSNVYDFSSDNINVFLMVLDASSSMRHDEENVKFGMERYRQSFLNFPESDSIAVAVSQFNDSYYAGDFRKVREMNVKYSTDGRTALYYSILEAADQLKDYMTEVARKTGTVPRGTLVFFSDGEPCGDRATREDARKAISGLNFSGVTTVFIAFGEAISSEFGKDIGFQSTVDVNNREAIGKFMGETLSKSCKEQSQSMKALGANFFSQAANKEASAGYSKTTAQALEDDDWIDDI